jgi:hypothetical protein
MSASKLRQSHHAILAPNEVVYGSGALQSLGRALLSRLVLFMKAVGSTWPYNRLSGHVDAERGYERCGHVLACCKTAFANRPELPCLTILEVRRLRSADHIPQKGGTPNVQHLEESRLEPAYVPRQGNRRVR